MSSLPRDIADRPGCAQLASETQSAHFAVFAFLLAGGVVLHNFQLGDWDVGSRTTALSLTSLWVMLRPGDTRRFLLLETNNSKNAAMRYRPNKSKPRACN